MINTERLVRDIIVIGGSAGGLKPIMSILEHLPGGLPAAIAVVLHRSPFHETRLPQVLGRHAELPVIEPADGLRLQRGMVYVAPRDHHLIFEDSLLRLDRGPKQHRTRPSIDPLFLSAAKIFGPRVVGVLLSGMGGDGVSGFLSIKAHGGITLVQRPSDSQFPTMPIRALREDDVDGALVADDIAPALAALAAGEAVDVAEPHTAA
jgi:two-component system chemotaxis response regulator CheB